MNNITNDYFENYENYENYRALISVPDVCVSPKPGEVQIGLKCYPQEYLIYAGLGIALFIMILTRQPNQKVV